MVQYSRSNNYQGYATAPYNFVPYNPQSITPADTNGLTYSGFIRCSLTALTPLLVAGPGGERERSGEESPGHEEEQQSTRTFFCVDGHPVIPGTSLKGMIRSLVETLSFSFMRPVSSEKIFWRHVTGSGNSAYKNLFPDPPLGGFLVQEGSRYKLFPARVTPMKAIGRGEYIDTTKYYKTGLMKNKHAVYKFDQADRNHPLELEREVVNDFFDQMTPAQCRNWQEEFDNLKIPGKGARVFYITDRVSGKVTALGTCRYFRIAYQKTPEDLAGTMPEEDFATALFGSVKPAVIRGRVAFSAASFSSYSFMEKPVEVVLGQPHPSCLLHYLAQDHARPSNNYKQEFLVDYNNLNARLRGRKYYWHRNFEPLVPANNNKKVSCKIYPIKENAKADFTVWVDRVHAAELGALLEALDLPPGHAHKLGLGKSMGMGSVRIDVKEVAITSDKERYSSLKNRFNGTGKTATAEEQKSWREIFKKHVLKSFPDAKNYQTHPAIRYLMLLTDYVHRPKNFKTKTMPLEQKYGEPNFSKTKALLPSAEDVNK